MYITHVCSNFVCLVNCVYEPDGNGKSKLDRMQDMLLNVVYQKHLSCQKVLMDSWDTIALWGQSKVMHSKVRPDCVSEISDVRALRA